MDMLTEAEALRQKLIECRGQYKKICEIGDLDYSWCSKFARGVIADPGVNRLHRLSVALDRVTNNTPSTSRP